jgi:DNA gyrase subunit A
VVGVKLVNDSDEVMIITDRGQTLRTRVDEIRETGRNAQGVKLMTLDEAERIVAVERLAEAVDTDDGGTIPPSDSLPPNGPIPDSELN